MGTRYKMPFAGKNDRYEVQILRGDYESDPQELRGASSCFVVSGNDERFVYTPTRLTTATMNVLEADILSDLYSINSHHAPVKLYKNGVLEWTGYIKPEQYTQPYRPTPQNIGVECVCAISTLEHFEYKTQTESGYITMKALLTYLIGSAAGGYRGVYIPMVYGSGSGVTEFLDEIELCEENFTKSEMTCLEVLEAVCKFFGWTLWDIHGCLWFVDADYSGTYRLYDEALSSYTEASGNAVLLQDIGYNGSDSNTLDIVPGYNKASVKSLNHVFDSVIEEEPFEILEVIDTWTYNEGDFEDARRCVRKYKEPMLWEMYWYDDHMNPITLEQVKTMEINSGVKGCMEVTENSYLVKSENGVFVPAVKEYTWVDMLRVRLDTYGAVLTAGDDVYKAFTVRGVNSVWKDGAFGVNMSLRYTTGPEMVETAGVIVSTYLYFELRIGENYWNGEEWVNTPAKFRILYNVNTIQGFQPIESNKHADMPYKGIEGHVVELPSDRVLKGDLEFTMYMNDPARTGVSGYFIKDFRLDYAKKDGVYDEGENGDRIYENIVNEAYMSECDEIEFDIGSYNEDGATYSKALMNGDFVTDNLYCAIVEEKIRPEELLIRRIVNRYSVTKNQLTEALQMTGSITPLTIVSERTQEGKTFRVVSGEWDYEQNRLVVQIQEDP